MKLKNKKTGEIIECKEILVLREDTDGIWQAGQCDSLAELNEEWCDYEEPKEHWCITMYGGITRIKDDEEPIDDLIEIGNYFNSKEDAYDALDKLKAWKWLKGTITRIDRASFDDVGTATLFIRYEKENHKEVNQDLDLLLSQEDEWSLL